MDWTPLIGRKRPRERDGLRLLTLVHQLGEPPAATGESVLHGEDRLQILDHLLRHPVDLALVVMSHLLAQRGDLGRRRATIARRVRRLLPHDPSERRRTDQHRLLPIAWERRDDVLATLACRDLLHVRPEGDRLAYVLTAAGVRLLGQIYPSDRAAALDLERCRLLADVLAPSGLKDLPAVIEATHQQLAALEPDDPADPGGEFLTHLFQITFEEPP